MCPPDLPLRPILYNGQIVAYALPSHAEELVDLLNNGVDLSGETSRAGPRRRLFRSWRHNPVRHATARLQRK